MTDKPAPPSAAAVYESRRHDIARLVDVLELELDKYDRKADAEPNRWDYAGTLGYVRTTLIDLVEGLSGMERERIEAFLAE